jgi:hypothetical protein
MATMLSFDSFLESRDTIFRFMKRAVDAPAVQVSCYRPGELMMLNLCKNLNESARQGIEAEPGTLYELSEEQLALIEKAQHAMKKLTPALLQAILKPKLIFGAADDEAEDDEAEDDEAEDEEAEDERPAKRPAAAAVADDEDDDEEEEDAKGTAGSGSPRKRICVIELD